MGDYLWLTWVGLHDAFTNLRSRYPLIMIGSDNNFVWISTSIQSPDIA